MKINRKAIIVIGSIWIASFAIGWFLIEPLLVGRTSNSPPRCVFDTLTPEEVVEIFFEVKKVTLNNPDAEILPYLSSNARNFLRPLEVDNLPGGVFRFINTEASIDYLHAPNMRDEHVARVFFHSPPHQGEDVNQRYKYALLEEALKNFLGESQMRGRTEENSSVSFWAIDDGMILLRLGRNYRTSPIIMVFSTTKREPVLLPFDKY